MKRIILLVLMATAMMCCAAGGGNDANQLQLQLPPVIYAVPGIESNVYFDNVVLTINPSNYFFDVDCAKGRNDAKRWRFIPTDKDVGTYSLKIKVLDSANQVAGSAETKLIVVPANAGKDKSISMLLVGDSLTDHTVYPRRIAELFKGPGNPPLKFVGSHAGGGKPAGSDGVCHEGYGGWRWKSFCETWTGGSDFKARSKFLVMKNGKPELDVKAYFQQHNNGATPDFIIFMLGSNDIYTPDDTGIDKSIETLNGYMDRLLAEFRRAAPNAIYGIALSPPPATSQDAFGKDYQCGQTRWQFKRNQHHLVAALLKKLSGDKANCLIPVYVNLDCDNCFPAIREPAVAGEEKLPVVRHNNGIHPAASGYRQIGDTFYCWIKYQLSATK